MARPTTDRRILGYLLGKSDALDAEGVAKTPKQLANALNLKEENIAEVCEALVKGGHLRKKGDAYEIPPTQRPYAVKKAAGAGRSVWA